jgi:hypothetical protein
MKTVFLSALVVVSAATAWAQKPAFSVTADVDTIALDEYVMLTVSMSNCDANSFQLPDLPEFKLAGRPSSQSSMMMMNGKITSSSTYTYHLLPTKAGKCTIDNLTVKDNMGKTLKADKIKIVILDKYRDPEAKGRFEQQKQPLRTSPRPDSRKEPIEDLRKPKRQTIRI